MLTHPRSPPAPQPLASPSALTSHRAAQHFQTHAQAAIPGKWVDPDESGHHRLWKLAQHRCVLVHIPVEGLGRDRTQNSTLTPSESPLWARQRKQHRV